MAEFTYRRINEKSHEKSGTFWTEFAPWGGGERHVNVTTIGGPLVFSDPNSVTFIEIYKEAVRVDKNSDPEIKTT